LNLFREIATNNDKSYIHSHGSDYSYNSLIQDADRFSSFTKHRPLVFIVANNSYDCLTGYVGLLRANAVVALINDSIHETMFKDLVKNFKPSIIYQPQNMFSLEINWKQRLKTGKYVLYETNFEIGYEINDNLSLLLMTSGSTGSPEFVRLSHSNIYSNTKSICEYLKISNNDVAMTTLPMSYSFGISIINTHLFMGASLVLTDTSLMEKKFWDLISRYKVTTFSGVPYTFEMLKKLKFENMHLSTINYVTQAGGKLRNSLLAHFSKVSTKKNIDFIVMYGQTEASPRMSYLPSEMLQSKIGSIGIPIPGGKFYLVDDEHEIVNEPNIEGELIYEGENVCMGYARDCYDLGKNDINKGILKTGDMAKVDSDSYYYITGRKKRFLKIFGNRVSLDQIEQKINEAGYDCACVGTDDYMKIYTTEKSYVQKIQDYIGKYFEINKSGFSIICINTIPRNHSGKILYSELVKN
jgi:acyl-CoA synthetase (AMP-forming)/AMP-acid ligase II